MGLLGLQQLAVTNAFPRICKEPHPDFPITANYSDARFYRTFASADVDCTLSHDRYTSDAGNSQVNRSTIHLTHPDYPAFYMLLNISNPSANFDEPLFYNSSSNTTYYAKHRYESLCIASKGTLSNFLEEITNI